SKHNAKYAVFHLPSREDLAQGLAELWEAFAALRKHPYWKDHVRGCVVALEITYKNGWHPHLNVLIDCPAYLNRQMLGDAWRDASGCLRAHTPWLQRANKGTVRELLKYVTKLGDLVDHDSPELIEQFLEATHGRRFIRTYGCFYGIPNPEDAEDDAGCPHCGAQLHLFEHTLYLHQVRLDEQGVWRPLDYALPPERGKPYTPLEPKSVVLPIPKNQTEEIWQTAATRP